MISDGLGGRSGGDVLPIEPESQWRAARDDHSTYEKLRIPKPSLLRLPPNKLVRRAALLPVAFWDARQGIETELSHGMMYAGRT